MASTGSVDGWPLGPTELGEAGLRVLLRLPMQASSSYTELKSSCARHDVRIRISRVNIRSKGLMKQLYFPGAKPIQRHCSTACASTSSCTDTCTLT